jgi:hypothetical protein
MLGVLDVGRNQLTSLQVFFLRLLSRLACWLLQLMYAVLTLNSLANLITATGSGGLHFAAGPPCAQQRHR